jgi:hypothetical protein
MTTSEYVALNIDLGFKILEASTFYWLINERGYAHSFPTLENCNPTRSDINIAFKSKCKFLLFKSDINFSNTHEYIYRSDKYELDQFDSKIRNQIRKGLKSCVLKDVDADSMISQGLEINRKTLKRQGRDLAYLTDKQKWEKYICAFYSRKDVYIRGAFVNDKLIGYIIFIKLDNRYIIQHPFRDEDHSSLNPINAILYSFINEIIIKEKFVDITYGLASFEEHQSLDKFKKGMLFSNQPSARLAVIATPYKLLFNKLIYSTLKTLGKINLIRSSNLTVYFYLYEAVQLYKNYYKNKNLPV